MNSKFPSDLINGRSETLKKKYSRRDTMSMLFALNNFIKRLTTKFSGIRALFKWQALRLYGSIGNGMHLHNIMWMTIYLRDNSPNLSGDTVDL